MLSPITLGCKTKTPKIIGIAITVLQRLVAAGGVPTVCPTLLGISADLQSALPGVLQTLNSVSNQGVDTQLKILQALLSVLTYNTDAHGEILGNVSPDRSKWTDTRLYYSALNYKMSGYQSYRPLRQLHSDKRSCSCLIVYLPILPLNSEPD
jgi:hypothetical protein